MYPMLNVSLIFLPGGQISQSHTSCHTSTLNPLTPTRTGVFKISCGRKGSFMMRTKFEKQRNM
jgi:hypothetical protein